MAGSYQHCLGDEGTFTFDLIENLGDAHEACEMMVYMIDILSRQLSKAEEGPFKRSGSHYTDLAEEAYHKHARGEVL